MVRAVLIVEVAGKPAEHVKESIEKHVNSLKERKDVTVNSLFISEPKKVVDDKEVFTCYSEIDLEVENLFILTEIVFDYMPSSVEVLEPANINLTSSQASSLLNNVSGRGHKYDEIAMLAQAKIKELKDEAVLLKKLLVDNKILESKDGKLVITDQKYAKGLNQDKVEESKLKSKEESKVDSKEPKKENDNPVEEDSKK